ncbi:MAG: rhodanese-like domain-containing protein, partial [Candidatus Neomarinimicrobiota bacterium]
LIGRLLLFDALAMSFQTVALDKNPDCPACGDQPTITELVDYDAFCGVQPETPATATNAVRQLEAAALAQLLDGVTLVDVREPFEAQIATIPGSKLIPLASLPHRLAELDPAEEIVLYCHTGVRSLDAAQTLQRAGFEHVWNLEGGIQAWSTAVDPSVPQY